MTEPRLQIELYNDTGHSDIVAEFAGETQGDDGGRLIHIRLTRFGEHVKLVREQCSEPPRVA